MPLFSVIVTAYNESDTILKCLTSITNQSDSSYELIIIDDCSSDNTFKRIQEIEQRHKNIRTYKNDHNIGLGQTRNRGLAVASGKYIIFVDGDDWLAESTLEMLRTQLYDDPDLLIMNHKLCYSDGFCVPAQQAELLREQPKEDLISQKSRLLRVFHTAWNKVYRRIFLIDNNLEFPVGNYEDLVFSYSGILLATKIRTFSGALYHYRQHPDTVPGRPNIKSSRVNHSIIFNRYQMLFSFLNKHGYLTIYGGILYTKMLNQYSAILCERIKGGMHNKKSFFNSMEKDARRYRLKEDVYFSNKDRVNIFLIRRRYFHILLALNATYTKYKQLSSR